MAQEEEEGEAAGLVSVLAQRAASEGPRWTRAMETRSATSLEMGDTGKITKWRTRGRLGWSLVLTERAQ